MLPFRVSRFYFTFLAVFIENLRVVVFGLCRVSISRAGQVKLDTVKDRDWIRTLEQLLLLILILGRWMLPKGKLTHDQLSQLLLVYIGTAADIVEFFEAFNEEKVSNRDAEFEF